MGVHCFEKVLIASFLILTLFAATAGHAEIYKDVPETHWAYEAISILSQLGILTGFPDGTFRGNESVTRYQLSVLVYRLYSLLTSRIESLKFQIESLEQKLKTSTSPSPSNLERSITQLEQNYHHLETSQRELKATLTNYSEKLKSTDAALKAVEENLQKFYQELNEEYNTLRLQLDEINLKLKSFSESSEVQKNAVETLRKELYTLSTNLESVNKLKTDVKKILEQTTVLSLRLKEVEGIIKTFEQTNSKQNVPEDAIGEPENDVKYDLEQVKEEIGRLWENITFLSAKVASIESSLVPAQYERFSEEIETIKKEIDTLKYLTELVLKTSTGEDDEKLGNQPTTIYTDNSAFEAVRQLEKAVADLLKNTQQIVARVENIESKPQVPQELESIKAKLRELETEIQKRATLSQVNSLNLNVQKILNLTLPLIDDVEKLKVKISEVSEKLPLLERNVNEIQAVVQNVEGENVSPQILEILNNQETKINALHQLVNKVMDQLSSLKEGIQSLRESLENLKKVQATEASPTISSFDLSLRFETLENKVVKLSQTFKELLETINAMGTDLETTKTLLSENITKIAALERSLNQEAELISNITKVVPELVANQKLISEHFTSLEKRISINEKTVEDIIVKLEKQEISFSKIIDEERLKLNEEFTAVYERLHSLERAEKNALENLRSHENSLDNLQKELTKLREQISLQNSIVEQNIRALEKRIESNELSVNSLTTETKSELQALKKEIDMIKSILQNYAHRLETLETTTSMTLTKFDSLNAEVNIQKELLRKDLSRVEEGLKSVEEEKIDNLGKELNKHIEALKTENRNMIILTFVISLLALGLSIYAILK